MSLHESFLCNKMLHITHPHKNLKDELLTTALYKSQLKWCHIWGLCLFTLSQCYTENQHCDKNRWVRKVKPERGLDQKLIMLPMYHVIFTKLKLLTNNQQVDESGLISPIAR